MTLWNPALVQGGNGRAGKRRMGEGMGKGVGGRVAWEGGVRKALCRAVSRLWKWWVLETDRKGFRVQGPGG